MIASEAKRSAVEAARPPDRRRLIAIMPAYNEAVTIRGVLERLQPLVDTLIIVDDGSVDDTRQIVFDWLEDKPQAHLISFQKNRGMSAAYYEALRRVRTMCERGEVDPDDIVITVDADGQHDPASIDELIAPLREGADAVIGRRDFRLYPLYKRVGNWIMSAWASLWSGRRFRDVESGYRAFRVGPLLDALQYYTGYRYSETVEVAVILSVLGYRIHDTTIVDIPVFRSRTRLKDVIIDLVAMPCAWWRVTAARRLPVGVPNWTAYYVLPLFFVGGGLALGRILTRTVYLADDTVNNYAHVWYISQHLFGHGTIPVRVALLDGGNAFAFPYALLPWSLNALLYQALGDWSVTLFLVLGALAAIGGAIIVRPTMRDPWLLLPFIANPFFIDAVASGQYAFLWAAAGFFVLVWAAERERWVLAGAAIWFTASTHPIEGALAIAAYFVWLLLRRPHGARRMGVTALVVAPMLAPSFYFAFETPALAENSAGTIIISILQDLPRRGSVIAAPFVLTWAAPFLRLHYRPFATAFAAIAVPGVLLSAGAFGDMPVVNAFDRQGSYYGLRAASTNPYRPYIASDDFHRGMVYRVLSPNDREQGAYALIRHGGVLANELFSESQQRHSWSLARYQCYLAVKRVERVAVEPGYVQQFRTNERDLLDGLVASGDARVTFADPNERLQVYDVAAFRNEIVPPGSIKECRGR